MTKLNITTVEKQQKNGKTFHSSQTKLNETKSQFSCAQDLKKKSYKHYQFVRLITCMYISVYLNSTEQFCTTA